MAISFLSIYARSTPPPHAVWWSVCRCAAVSNGLGYCETVEKLLNVEAPPRAQHVRVILTELNRIASHQLWLGTHALDIGAITPLFYTFRDREEILKIYEKYCGARLTTHAFRIGGLQYETYT